MCDNTAQEGFNQNSLNTLQKTFPLVIPKFECFILKIRNEQNFSNIIELETRAPLECKSFCLECEEFVVDNLVTILDKFLHYSKNTLERLQIAIKYKSEEKHFNCCSGRSTRHDYNLLQPHRKNQIKYLKESLLEKFLENFLKCKKAEVEYFNSTNPMFFY